MRASLLILFFLFSCSLYGQDGMFTQYYNSGIYLNPALSSTEPSTALSLNSRYSSLGSSNAFFTNQVSLLHPIKDKNTSGFTKIGTALSFVSDQAGAGNLSSTGGYLNVSYNLKISNNQSLSLGVQGGYIQKYVDLDKFTWNSQYVDNMGWDGSIASGNNLKSNRAGMMDVSTGLFYINTLGEDVSNTSYIDKIGVYVGVSAYHLTEPKDAVVEGSESLLTRRYNFHAGGGFMVSSKILLSPNVLFALQGDMYQLNSGVLMDYYLSDKRTGITPSDISFGLWYRLKDSFIASVGVFNDSYEIGFSFDHNSSSLLEGQINGDGIYELYLKLRMPTKGEVMIHKPRYIIID